MTAAAPAFNLATEWAKYEPEVAAFVGKVQSVLTFVTTNKTVTGIAAHIPEAPAILAALGVASAPVAAIVSAIPAVGEVIALYETYKALGGRPMDASDIAKMKPADDFA